MSVSRQERASRDKKLYFGSKGALAVLANACKLGLTVQAYTKNE